MIKLCILIACDTGAHGHVPISGLNSRLVSSAKDLPRRTHPTSFHEFSMVQPTRSPNTRLVFIARNLSSIEALRGMSVVSLPQSFRIGMSLNLKSTVIQNRNVIEFEIYCR